ncbi:hypothetical protein CHS0354_024536 [Potamilus streckersoni]|uniref:Uncharacterized protein n=1 Tax=Potamilus streckersoni TaxID=2493646 RepID=A0AAE0TNM0_9BIVA|nr:hypothetical protein CHS0354_024536 [Potamilus streckersoni]
MAQRMAFFWNASAVKRLANGVAINASAVSSIIPEKFMEFDVSCCNILSTQSIFLAPPPVSLVTGYATLTKNSCMRNGMNVLIISIGISYEDVDKSETVKWSEIGRHPTRCATSGTMTSTSDDALI